MSAVPPGLNRRGALHALELRLAPTPGVFEGFFEEDFTILQNVGGRSKAMLGKSLR